MAWILLAIGLVLIVEGLVVTLAPSRIEEFLALLARMPVDTRRLVGLTALTIGATLVTVARLAGL